MHRGYDVPCMDWKSQFAVCAKSPACKTRTCQNVTEKQCWHKQRLGAIKGKHNKSVLKVKYVIDLSLFNSLGHIRAGSQDKTPWVSNPHC